MEKTELTVRVSLDLFEGTNTFGLLWGGTGGRMRSVSGPALRSDRP
jgi:hypothetical protein